MLDIEIMTFVPWDAILYSVAQVTDIPSFLHPLMLNTLFFFFFLISEFPFKNVPFLNTRRPSKMRLGRVPLWPSLSPPLKPTNDPLDKAALWPFTQSWANKWETSIWGFERYGTKRVWEKKRGGGRLLRFMRRCSEQPFRGGFPFPCSGDATKRH